MDEGISADTLAEINRVTRKYLAARKTDWDAYLDALMTGKIPLREPFTYGEGEK